MVLAPFNQNFWRHVSSIIKGKNFKQFGRLLRKGQEYEQERKHGESWELDHHG